MSKKLYSIKIESESKVYIDRLCKKGDRGQLAQLHRIVEFYRKFNPSDKNLEDFTGDKLC